MIRFSEINGYIISHKEIEKEIVCQLSSMRFSELMSIPKEKKPIWKMIRIPLPWQKSRPLSTPKGKKGYDRKRAKKEAKGEVAESSIEK